MTERIVFNAFSGRQSGIAAFKDAGWKAVTAELEPRFPGTTFVGDFEDVTVDQIREAAGGPILFSWNSVPCTSYSMASVRHHWDATGVCAECGEPVRRANGEVWAHVSHQPCQNPRPVKLHGKAQLTYTPKSETARKGRSLLRHTLNIMEELQPRWWVIENPRAMMRVMPEVQGLNRYTITHCQYGDPRRMKPTDLFGFLPEGFEPLACKNGASCHEAAPRGAKTGTQGLKDAEERSLIPYGLTAAILDAIEEELS